MDQKCDDDFLSTYRQTYRKFNVSKELANHKTLNARNKEKSVEYRDPISESFKDYLVLQASDKFDVTVEDLQDYYEHAKDKYSWLADITNNTCVPNEQVKRNRDYEERTQYNVDYCDLDKELAYKEEMLRNRIRLSHDIHIPESTQQSGYREPRMMNSRCYEREKIRTAESSLEPNYKIREILKVNTGDSEYTRRIGKLGRQIIDEKLLGYMKYN